MTGCLGDCASDARPWRGGRRGKYVGSQFAIVAVVFAELAAVGVGGGCTPSSEGLIVVIFGKYVVASLQLLHVVATNTTEMTF